MRRILQLLAYFKFNGGLHRLVVQVMRKREFYDVVVLTLPAPASVRLGDNLDADLP